MDYEWDYCAKIKITWMKCKSKLDSHKINCDLQLKLNYSKNTLPGKFQRPAQKFAVNGFNTKYWSFYSSKLRIICTETTLSKNFYHLSSTSSFFCLGSKKNSTIIYQRNRTELALFQHEWYLQIWTHLTNIFRVNFFDK